MTWCILSGRSLQGPQSLVVCFYSNIGRSFTYTRPLLDCRRLLRLNPVRVCVSLLGHPLCVGPQRLKRALVDSKRIRPRREVSFPGPLEKDVCLRTDTETDPGSLHFLVSPTDDLLNPEESVDEGTQPHDPPERKDFGLSQRENSTPSPGGGWKK